MGILTAGPVPDGFTGTRTGVCNLCEAICGLELTLEKGRVTSIRGNPADPLSSAPDTNGYWLLIVSDVPITARDIDEQLQSAALWTVPPSTMVQVLPGAIVGTRTSGWAAYAVPLH